MESEPAEPTSVGIVGAGNLGQHLGNQLTDHPRATARALTEVDPDTRAAAGDAVGVEAQHRYEVHTEMFESEPLDAVVIATPHTLHYRHVHDAFDHGLHVLCEKPLATDTDRAVDLATRADSEGLTLMVGYQRHLDPRFRRARERWRSGDHEPQFLTAETTQDWISGFADAWRTDPELSGGGQLYDSGSHLVDAVLWSTGLTPVSVSAEMAFDDDARRVDKHAALSVTFANGAVGTIAVSADTRQRREHVHVYDESGAVSVARPDVYTVTEADGTERRPDLGDDDHPTKAEAFVDSVRTGAEPPATAFDAVAVTALTEAAYQSARTGERVEIEIPERPAPPSDA